MRPPALLGYNILSQATKVILTPLSVQPYTNLWQLFLTSWQIATRKGTVCITKLAIVESIDWAKVILPGKESWTEIHPDNSSHVQLQDKTLGSFKRWKFWIYLKIFCTFFIALYIFSFRISFSNLFIETIQIFFHILSLCWIPSLCNSAFFFSSWLFYTINCFTI